MTRARILILLPLLLAAPACKRSDGNDGSRAETAKPDRLMPRHPDQQPRADTTGAERVTCKKEVPSIPCTP